MSSQVPTALEKDSLPNRGYIAFHAPRFAFLLEVLQRYVRRTPIRVLDVGRSHLTAMVSRQLRIPVDSLGLEPEQELSAGHHYCFDLNETQFPERWRCDLGPYDVILFAEVIEHLHTAPELVVAFLRRLLLPQGMLILQTPNAASLSKRIKPAMGINPFERIRTDRLNPGHYREYTLDELFGILEGSGFLVQKAWRRHYFDVRFARHQTGRERPSRITGSIRNVAYRMCPPALREGITILARRTDAAAPLPCLVRMATGGS